MPDMNEWNKQVIAEFRENEGKVGGQFEGAPLLLLHSTGAKSGQERINPLMYQAVGDSIAIFASAAGGPSDPDWLYNLIANPSTTMELGTDTVAVTARVLDDAEREPIWTKQKSDFANFAEYEQMTSRQIPVVVLDPK